VLAFVLIGLDCQEVFLVRQDFDIDPLAGLQPDAVAVDNEGRVAVEAGLGDAAFAHGRIDHVKLLEVGHHLVVEAERLQYAYLVLQVLS